MMLATLPPSESSQPTKSLEYPTIEVLRPGVSRKLTPASSSTPIYILEANITHGPVPDGYTDITDIIAEREKDETKRAALEKARRSLAQNIEKSLPPSLATLRLRAGLSQHSLAKSIGNSQPGYSRIESGKAQPTFDTMEKLVEVLHVSWDELALAIKVTMSHG